LYGETEINFYFLKNIFRDALTLCRVNSRYPDFVFANFNIISNVLMISPRKFYFFLTKLFGNYFVIDFAMKTCPFVAKLFGNYSPIVLCRELYFSHQNCKFHQISSSLVAKQIWWSWHSNPQAETSFWNESVCNCYSIGNKRIPTTRFWVNIIGLFFAWIVVKEISNNFLKHFTLPVFLLFIL
jgi:hypothetical protein